MIKRMIKEIIEGSTYIFLIIVWCYAVTELDGAYKTFSSSPVFDALLVLLKVFTLISSAFVYAYISRKFVKAFF